ncbi:class I SAM-dependent methyltransferase [Thalassococcus sp. CAU 1522]|uniref:Class I SAM-dependent methyltransferase n=1 Tax=Thalassococcus arenae TaxID=2851652 RepID=A0ABS6N7D5_9RHOB|nr:class I SAM-dependent methyltransferase [Thalassococcus arenae]MBV2359926.1 class I SAM-dependent methyltransferase [Thalassococcus arenae]
MRSDRLQHALKSGLVLPDDARCVLIGAPGDFEIDAFAPGSTVVQQDFRPDFDHWERRGVTVTDNAQGPFDIAIAFIPRARALAESRVAQACALAPGGLVIIDGQKEDGVESVLKAMRGRTTLEGVVSKAHGKLAWLAASDAFADWAHGATRNSDGFWTAPGVFSSDATDPASAFLADALPRGLSGQIADLGAGWGALAPTILRSDTVAALHLVEADKAALDCARRNVTDPRAHFHWADATTWKTPAPLDAVVMNPPFHAGRRGDPGIGQSFIAAAARLLSQSGHLWMVANRHLPYEAALTKHFRDCTETGGDARFKILHARRPTRHKG